MTKPRKTDERLKILQNTCKRAAFQHKSAEKQSPHADVGQKKRADKRRVF
jgi:hypothetical protein